jgi:hypothetical protein
MKPRRVLEEEEYNLIRIQTEPPNKSVAPVAPIKRKKPVFVKVPLHLAAAVAKATDEKAWLVWILILYRCWREQKHTIVLPNALMHQHGIGRKTKYRALKQLMAYGLIEVKWQTRKNPIVTVIL